MFGTGRDAWARERGVRLVVAGEAREAEALELLVRDLLARHGATVDARSADAVDPVVVIERPAHFEPALARVWIDLRPDDHAMVFLVDGAWERVLVRRVPRDPAHGEVCREDIGHILETAIEAMLAGAKIGVERAVLAPPPRPVVRPRPRRRARVVSPPPPPRRSDVFRVGLASETMLFSSEVPVTEAVGVTASLEAPLGAGARAPRAGGWLTIAYRFPLRTTALPLGVRLQGLELRLLGRAAWPLGRALRVEVALGPGLDLVDVTPIANRPDASLTAPSTEASFSIRGAVGARLWNVLGILVAADADLGRHDYTFVEGGQRFVALSPFAVRPALLLEAEFR